MDNDGALLEVLRNTYKGLRFRWKYRGLIILPAEQGNAAAADAIRAGQPFLFGRCGATEMRTVAEYLNENKIQTRPIWKLIHTLKPYQNCQSYKIEKALKYYEKIVNIPCSTNLTKEDMNRVVEKIRRF